MYTNINKAQVNIMIKVIAALHCVLLVACGNTTQDSSAHAARLSSSCLKIPPERIQKLDLNLSKIHAGDKREDVEFLLGCPDLKVATNDNQLSRITGFSTYYFLKPCHKLGSVSQNDSFLRVNYNSQGVLLNSMVYSNGRVVSERVH